MRMRFPSRWLASSRLVPVLAANLLLLSLISTRVQATSDSLVAILMPIENLHEEGYCEWQTIAWDAVSTATWSGFALISATLSHPLSVPLITGGMPYELRQVNVNPITSGSEDVTVTFDPESVASDFCKPKAYIRLLRAIFRRNQNGTVSPLIRASSLRSYLRFGMSSFVQMERWSKSKLAACQIRMSCVVFASTHAPSTHTLSDRQFTWV